MNTRHQKLARHVQAMALLVGLGMIGAATLPHAVGQVRGARGGGGGGGSASAQRSGGSASTQRSGGSASAQRSTAATTTTTATRSSSTSVHTSGTAVRGGAAVQGEEGYAAVGRNGAVVKGEDGFAAVGRNGAVVAGEEGVAAAGRHGGVVVGNRYESYEAWRVVAGVGAAIAVGTMLANPPSAATTVVVGGTTYWVHQNQYFMRVMTGGAVAYQAVARPM